MSSSPENDDAADWGVEIEGAPLGPREDERTARGIWSVRASAFGPDLSVGEEMNPAKPKSRPNEDKREEDHSPLSLGAVDKDNGRPWRAAAAEPIQMSWVRIRRQVATRYRVRTDRQGLLSFDHLADEHYDASTVWWF